MKDSDKLTTRLREHADWCDANEWEIPICMGDDQREAADLIEGLQAQLAESRRRERVAAEDSIFRCCKTCWKRGRGYNGSCRYCKYCEFVPDGFKRGQRDLWAYCGPAAEEGVAE